MRKSLIFSFSLIGQVGLATALPLVILGLLGRYLDNKFGTGHYLFLTGLLIATLFIYQYLKKIVKQAQETFINL